MSFSLELVIPKNTTLAAPVSTTGAAGGPFVYGGAVLVPEGCAGLVWFRLFARGGVPLAPSGGGWINGGNGREVRFGGVGRWRVDGPPYTITLQAYNLDLTFPHKIVAEIEAGI